MANNNSKQKGTSFFYENLEREDSLVNRISVVQPKMLPPFFRERTRWQQKLYIFLILVTVAASVGITAFAMINDLAASYQMTTGSQIASLIFTWVMWYFVVIIAAFFAMWSRRRYYLLSLWDLIAGLIAPILLIIVSLLMYLLPADTFAASDRPSVLILALAVASVLATTLTSIVVLIGTAWQRRTYPNGTKRAFFLVPGLIIASAAPLILWVVGYNDSFKTFELDQVLYPIIVIVVGFGFYVAGAMYTVKYRSAEPKTASQWVQLSSSLPSAVILVTLLIVGFRFATKNEFLTPLISVFICDVVLVAAYMAYLFLRGRIRNINRTNPLYNEFVTRGFVALILVLGLIHVAIIPNLIATTKSYAPTSFAILAVTSAAALFVIFGAHFSNIVVYQRYEKVMMAWAAIMLVVVLIIIFVLGGLNQSQVFINVFARGITLALIGAELVNEIIILVLSSLAVQVDLIKNAAPHKLKMSFKSIQNQTRPTVLEVNKEEVVKEKNGK